MRRACLLTFVLGVSAIANAAPLQVASVSPPAQARTPIYTPISVTFDRAVNASTVSASTFRVYGRVSGPVGGSFTFANGGRTATLRGRTARSSPARPCT